MKQIISFHLLADITVVTVVVATVLVILLHKRCVCAYTLHHLPTVARSAMPTVAPIVAEAGPRCHGHNKVNVAIELYLNIVLA